jgi:hypothetical protein
MKMNAALKSGFASLHFGLAQPASALFLCILFFAAPAQAAEVFVNGVSVDGLTSTTFEKVNVKLDDKGNVYIDAPGYSIKRVNMGTPLESGQPRPLAAIGITQKYYLVTEQRPSGLTEFDFEVFINGKFYRTLKSGEEQLVIDISKQLSLGKNTVVVQAKKNLANKEAPKSISKEHIFRVIVGEAHVKGDQVTIEKQLVNFSRTAADATDVVQEFVVTTR